MKLLILDETLLWKNFRCQLSNHCSTPGRVRKPIGDSYNPMKWPCYFSVAFFLIQFHLHVSNHFLMKCPVYLKNKQLFENENTQMSP